MADRLDGTVAAVTGASSGIGEATAHALAANGATVALVARRRDRLKELANELHKAGGRALVVEADVSVEDQARAAIQGIIDQLGRLDTLVNNAGVMLLGPAVDAPFAEWKRMVEVNLLGVLYCSHAAFPHLIEAAANGPRNVADLVNISSTAGRIAREGSAVYNATKFGMSGFTESLRQELSPRFVRASLVEPGMVATELRTHNRPEVRESMQKRIANIEILQPEDIADAITYVVTRPRRVAVNEMLVRPTAQQQ